MWTLINCAVQVIVIIITSETASQMCLSPSAAPEWRTLRSHLNDHFSITLLTWCSPQWLRCTFTANITQSGILSAEEMLCLREETVTSIWRWPGGWLCGSAAYWRPLLATDEISSAPFFLNGIFKSVFLFLIFISRLQFVPCQTPNQTFCLLSDFSSKIQHFNHLEVMNLF